MFEFTLGQILLFVKNPSESAKFYNEKLNLIPAFEHSTYVMFVLKNGIKLGLWSFEDAKLQSLPPTGACEICFLVDDVDKTYEELSKKGIVIDQEPIDLDFGRTFVFLDPDGHRIRVYKLQRKE